MNVRLGAGVKAVEPAPDGHTRVLLDEGPAIEAQQLILAVGRTPATTGLGTYKLGIRPAMMARYRRRAVATCGRFMCATAKS